ncbi:uncharacterized protein LOC129952436 [Eupeodes corollae]|uniref:uncharacterized protein LOC129952436 n=1 Tax=Eupeodes corollae TaxID=290404 RepID=UPI002492E372|nr:uncharacterized protein LOC129952436 [Eupeodes corollae]XP_055920985.1 uncharacterized protein LOC129952436 [Eupeodes corollae]
MITIIISSVFASIGLLLIIGAWKKFHLMLLPWLIIEGLMLVLYFMQTFFNLMDFRSFDLSRIDLSIVRFLIIGLCAYVWFGILTLYQYIRDEKRKSSTENYKEYLVCSKTDPNEVNRRIESYPPPYVIPIIYSDPKQPPSQIKF